MSYAESYDQCMTQKGLPPLGEILSRKTLSEALAIFEEIDQALEGAGGKELTFSGLSALGGAGLSPSAMEVVGLLAAVAADLTVFLYMTAAAQCLGVAVIKNSLFAELDTASGGAFKDQVQSQAEAGGTATA